MTFPRYIVPAYLVGGIYRTLGRAAVNTMIYYFNPITYHDLVLSIDGVILDVSISNPERMDLLNQILSSVATKGKGFVQTWTSFKPGTFRRQTLIQIDDDRSFWIGQGLNGNGTLVDRVRLDFNPNKVGNDPNFKLVRDFLVRNSRADLCRIPRFDLAIDIPVAREKCFLVKDRRLYLERRHGEEYTQYLGSKSSKVGRVKLYNKALEAQLDSPLTRLELTLSPDTPFENINFPKVFCVNEDCADCQNARLTDTQRFIVNAVIQGFGTLNGLGRKTRAKIEVVLKEKLRTVSISKASYNAIIEQLQEYLK